MSSSQPSQTYQRYVDAWSPIDREERHRLLTDVTVPEIEYLDANVALTGTEGLTNYLTGFQERQPGSKFDLDMLLVFQDQGLARWTLRDAEGRAVFSGYDSICFADDGRLSRVTGFSDVPKHQAI